MSILELFKVWSDEEKKQAIAGMDFPRQTELASALLGAGFSASAVLGAGFSASALLGAGFSASAVLGAGFSASALLGAGFSASALLGAGFSASELRGAGFSASELRGTGFSASELRGAGFSASELQLVEKMEIDCKTDIQEKARKMGRSESEFVLHCLKVGLMKGDSYGTLKECGCLLGSAAKAAGQSVEAYCSQRGIVKASGSPAEQWFMNMRIGDTPENNYAAKMGVEWIEEVLAEQTAE